MERRHGSTNSVFLGADPGPVVRFVLAGGKLVLGSTTPSALPKLSYGTTPFVSANGASNGIVWVLIKFTAPIVANGKVFHRDCPRSAHRRESQGRTRRLWLEVGALPPTQGPVPDWEALCFPFL
jgi:hypothetical protein